MAKTVVASFLVPFAQRVRALGGDPVALATALGIPDPESKGRAWISPDDVRRFCDEASQATGDPDLGLNAALERPAGSFGLVEFGGPQLAQASCGMARSEMRTPMPTPHRHAM